MIQVVNLRKSYGPLVAVDGVSFEAKLDEPSAGVDPQSRNALFDNIERLKQQVRTVLYTTHYMEEAERLCDRVAIMDRGRLLDLDTVPELCRRHDSPDLESVFLKLTGR